MAGLQRSAVSFRRQGSSGLVWDDKFLKELNQEIENSNSKQKEQEQAAAAVEISSSQQDQQEQQQQQPQVDVKPPRSVNTTIERSRSNGGGGGGGAGARGYRTGRVSPAIEPPSPRVSACGFCSAFANKPPKNNTHAKRTGKRRSRPF